MKFLIKISILCLTLTLSCTTMKKSFIKNETVFSIPNSNFYTTVGAIKATRLYFDPLRSEDLFEEASNKILNTLVPDALYDLDGDICWISSFDITNHSPKCAGLCTEISFDIIALKQK